MKKVIAKTIKITNNQNLLVWSLLGVLVFLIVSYLFFINNAVMNISMHESNKEAIIVMESELSSLEHKYIELSGKIDMKLARELGFSDARVESFVTRKNSSITLARLSLDEI